MKRQLFERIRACGWHLLGSVCIALLLSALVFCIWYPGALASSSGVKDIFFLLLLVDVILGPIITLIIFNPQKKELLRDLTIIIGIQLAAMLYGLHAVFIARPVYIAYTLERFDLVYANQISDKRLAKAVRPEYESLPVFGPELIAAPLPEDLEKREEIVLSVVLDGGDDVQQMPQYYVPYVEQKAEVIAQLKSLDELNLSHPNKSRSINALIRKYETLKTDVGYLPVKGRVNDSIAVVSYETGDVLEITYFETN